MEAGVFEAFVELIHLVKAVGIGGLLDEVVEEVFEKSSVSVVALDGKFGEIVRAVDADGVEIRSFVVAAGINRFILFVSAEAAGGVEVFEAEADGIDDGVAGHAAFVFRQMSDLFAHREVRLKVSVFELDGIWGRFQEAAKDVSAKVDAAMDGRGLLMVGESGEDVGVGEKAGAFAVGSGKGFKGSRFGFLGAVEFCEAMVEEDVLLGEESSVVGAIGPDDAIDKEIK